MLVCLLVGLMLCESWADPQELEQTTGDAPSMRPKEKPRT